MYDDPSLNSARQHVERCGECRHLTEGMAQEVDHRSMPNGAVLLLAGRAYRLEQAGSDASLLRISGLKIMTLAELVRTYAADSEATGVFCGPGRSFAFHFNELVDGRISLKDVDASALPTRLAAAPRNRKARSEPTPSLCPIFTRATEPGFEVLIDDLDRLYVRLATPVAEE